MRVHELWTSARTRFAISATLVFSLAFNLVVYWEVRLFEIYDPCTRRPWTVGAASKLNIDRVYIILYSLILTPLVKIILPFAILFALNLKIILALRKASQKRRNMAGTTATGSGQQSRRITIMVVMVMTVVLFCNTPNAIRNGIFIGVLNALPQLVQDKTIYAIWAYSFFPANWLLALNSSVNFFVYTIANKDFRQALSKCCGCSKGQGSASRESGLRSLPDVKAGRRKASSDATNETYMWLLILAKLGRGQTLLASKKKLVTF